MTTVSKTRPMKIGEERSYEVEGVTIVLRKVEPSVRKYEFRAEPYKNEKARYEITVGGEVLGFINAASGFGKEWYIQAHGKVRGDVWEADHPINVFPGGIGSYAARREWDRDTLVLQVPRLIAEGKLPSRDVLRAAAEATQQRQTRRAAEQDRSLIEGRQKEWFARKAARVARIEQIEALESILTKLRSEMTNAEVHHLGALIDRLKAEHDAENSRDLYWYDTEATPDATPNEKAALDQ